MIQESYKSPFVTKADYQEQTKVMISGFGDVYKKIDDFEERSDKKFAEIDQKFDNLTEVMMGNFDRVYERFDKMDTRFDRLDDDMELIKMNLIAINQHLSIKDATISA